jgi:exopolysaccharide biosynthesis protein
VFTKIQLLLLAFITMTAGFITIFYMETPAITDLAKETVVPYEPVSKQIENIQLELTDVRDTYSGLDTMAVSSANELNDIRTVLAALTENAKLENALYEEQKKAIDQAVALSAQHTKDTTDVLDTILSNILGKPIGQTFGKSATIKVFSLKEAGYRGYMAKVKLHNPKAVKLVMSGDTIGHKGETTSSAAKRTNALLAINAGGFAKGDDGLLYPMGITVVDGEIKTFYRTDLSFIGINNDGELVGGDVKTREQVEEMDINHGATFVPTLLKNGKKLTIPKKYANKKEPRTLIGHFSNGDLLFIVIDGRQKESAGVTLEEAQKKLLEFNVRDAYNLDGGGSSSFVYKNKVLNSPSDGQERKVVSSFVIVP